MERDAGRESRGRERWRETGQNIGEVERDTMLEREKEMETGRTDGGREDSVRDER